MRICSNHNIKEAHSSTPAHVGLITCGATILDAGTSTH
jgi:hypothetical protein